MSVNFSLNGVMQSACAGGSLADYIRDSARLRGTKIGCGEGGCGACTVMVTNPDGNAISVNSCLYPLAAVDGRAVTTVEGLGKNHAVPERIAALNGTQCGYCSPGFVMNMFAGLKKGNGSVTMRDMEGRMDGNICRCTGYRPLLDAAKSFATDSDVVDAIRGQDIKAMPKPDLSVADPPAALKSVKPAAEHKGDTTLPHVPAVWRKPANVADALAALADAAARPVGGSTSAGVYKSHLPGTLLKVDVRDLPELQGIAKEGNGLKVGAATTLTQLEAALRSFGTPASVALADHLLKVASVHVRNTATIAGNLMMAKTLGFWSDVATLLLGVGASVTWAKGVTESMEAFLSSPDAPNRLVQSVTIPLDAPRIQSYRVAARPLFAHAFLNACFTANVEGGKITAFNAAYGCVSEPDVPGSHAVLCPKTAAALVGQPLGDATLKAGLAALAAEVAPVGEDAAYRASLAASFLAKFLASLEGPQAPEPPRPMHSSTQSWDKAELAGPMHQPLVKIEASRQCDGSAQFVADIPMREGTLHGAFVKSSRARAVITAIDTAPALALGAVRVITAADIPGANDTNALGPVRPIFADKKVTFHAQQLALVLAPTPQLAAAAAAAVKVTYADDEAPAVCSLEQGMASTEAWCHPPVANDFNSADKDAEALIKAAPEERKVSGRVNVGGQQHFYMEPQAAYAFTDEDGVVQVHCPSQWHAATVGKIAAAVGVSQSRIRLVMRRAGGGFGGKLCHQIQFGAAAAVAAVVTGNPVKIVLDRVTDLQICGGREETIADYECAFGADGKIEAIKMHAWLNGGFTHELSFFANMVVPQQLNQVYHLPAFKLHSENVLTNTAVRTAMRGPGDMAATYTIETVLEHIATKLGVDPNAIREVNMISDEPAAFEEQKKLPNGTALEQQDYTAPAMWRKLKAADRGDYEAKKREVDDFNAKNKWKKRGVSMTPLRYGLSTFPKTALVNISTDGSVVCHAGGSEIGQGLCTKVAMAAAHELGKLYDGKVDLMPHIRVAECDSTIVPNQTFTGGSTSSEASMGATMDACAKLVAQMKPVLETLRKAKEGGEEVSWVELCGAAGNSFPAQPQCLVQSGHWSNTGEQAVAYNTYGVGLTVVEVDVLTGETQVLYTRFIYDCGKSINPAIDIGQAEGAFVIALGHVLQEQVVIDDKTGEVTSASTWKYKPPLAVNLPTEFICEFNDTPHAKGILSSKASGEPPMCLAISGVGTAVRHAVAAARKDFGHDAWCELPIPLTPPVVAAACGAKL